ncbi:MAG: sulfite exporter TauE/SafE family protein [Bdellovibrionales bacterium]
MILACLALGAVVGLLSSFLGIGGGIVIVPMLPVIAGLSTKEAVATSMLIVLFVTAKNIYSFQKKSLIHWSAGINIGAGAAVTSLLATLYIKNVNEKFLIQLLMVTLVAIGIRLLFFGKFTGSVKKDSKFSWAALVAGAFCGVIVGFTGIGGGVLYGPILLGLGLVSDKRMSPTSNLAMFLAALTGIIGFVVQADIVTWEKIGYLRPQIALIVFAAAFFTSQLGYKFQDLMNAKLRRILLSFVILVVLYRTSLRL